MEAIKAKELIAFDKKQNNVIARMRIGATLFR